MICHMSLLVIWHHWLQHHIMPISASMVPLHFLSEDNSNDMQYDSCSCDATGASVSITWCWRHHHWNHCIFQVMSIKMRCNMSSLVMLYQWCWYQHHVMLITSSVTQLYSLGQDDPNEVKITFWSSNSIGTGMDITWCWWHHQCHQAIS